MFRQKKKQTEGEAKQIYKSPTYPLTSFKNNATIKTHQPQSHEFQNKKPSYRWRRTCSSIINSTRNANDSQTKHTQLMRLQRFMREKKRQETILLRCRQMAKKHETDIVNF